MLFKRLVVKDFGPFRGKHIFDLETRKTGDSSKPIILFGGKNGTGKTTLLEAIKICLFGEYFRGKKLSRREYQKYLLLHLHRSMDGQVSSNSSIGLKFSYANSGYVNEYAVRRSWSLDGRKTMEKLEVRQNGSVIRDIDEEQWQDFLMELIPPGLSSLFFFDGEHIQSLAEGEDENKCIFNSINSLLGLDLVERLRSDLKIYALRKAKGDGDNVEAQIIECERRKRTLEQQLELLMQRKSNLAEKIHTLEYTIEEQERRISKEGGGFANKREELKSERKRLDETIQRVEDDIRDLCSDMLPFAYVPDLCLALRDRLRQEEKEQQKAAAAEFLNQSLDSLVKEIAKEDLLTSVQISDNQKLEIARSIIKQLKGKINANEVGHEYIHPMSPPERSEILGWIDVSLNSIPSRLAKLTIKRERLARERQRVQTLLFHVPADDVLEPLLKELGSLHEEIGSLQEQYHSLEEEERKTTNEIGHANRELVKCIEARIQHQKMSERLLLVEKVQEVLREYLDKLREEKLEEFRENFFECLDFLFSKKIIRRIDINPEDFQVSLTGNGEAVIPKSVLSAGEKQVYAVAMLWALARTSGRPIPFMIDAPMGRLDVEHRERVVRKFFPNASHQVIIFSTDTEIDRAYFNELRDYVSRTYRLVYDVSKGETKVEKRYFWEDQMEVAVNEF